MDQASRRFPFPTSFQFRDDERAGLEALFKRTFFEEPFTPEAVQALLRTCYQRGSTEAAPPEGKPAASGASGIGPEAAAAKGPLACAYPGDAPRYVLLYRGADGIGKTRVFRQFRESAWRKQISVYEVYHHDVEGIPFKPILHAVREILRDHDHGAALQEKYRYGLERLLPELYEPRPPSRNDESRGGRENVSEDSLHFDEAGKVRVFDAITQLLIEVTAAKPLLILVHDLQWSDRPTVELLDYIGRNLQIRRHPVAADGRDLKAALSRRDAGSLARPGGEPDLEDFDSEELRSLSRSVVSAQELLGVNYYAFPPATASRPYRAEAESLLTVSSTAALAAGELDTPTAVRKVELAADTVAGPPQAPRLESDARLMILANYRGFADPTHYLEQAIRALGEQPFAYHGELRPLSSSEAGQFLAKCLEGVTIDGREIAAGPELVGAIYEACEGFPSFMHELLRALYLREGGFRSSADAREVWSKGAIETVLAGYAGPPAAAEAAPSASDSAPAQSDALGAGSTEDPPARHRRHAVLRLRLASATRDELRVLQALATVRRPVLPALLGRVLEGLLEATESSLSTAVRVAAALESLEARGIVEHHEAGETGYFFRLGAYATVVDETIPSHEKNLVHQRVGEEYRARLTGADDEAAFEVYYHLRRGLDPEKSLDWGRIAVHRFVRSFAYEKARRVQKRLLDLVASPEDLRTRLAILTESARISRALKDGPAAEEALRQAQAEGAAELSAEEKTELVLLEAEAAHLTDSARALKILGRATKHLKDENTPLGVRLQLLTARLRLDRQDLKRAINFSLKGISICQKLGDLPELGELYRTMATAFYRKGDYAHAVDNYQRALDAFERAGLRDASVGALDDLGRVYLERGNHFRAAGFLYKSLEIRRRQHDLPGLCKSYDELGRVYLRSGDYLKTIESLNRSLSLKERIGDFAGLNPTLLILGDLYFRLGRYEKSLDYFRREVENSQALGDTRGLVEGLGQLGRVHFELGDTKQAGVYAKQVSILATEFKLKSQEADGALLQGGLSALARDWAGAEKSFRLASEVHGKLGHRRRETSAFLDFAEVKLTRELYDESLKLASKGQLIAEEVKAADLQVRALTIKGSLHRFLKGGNPEKAREFLHKALELSQKISDVGPLFQLHYSLAKLCHSQREFAEAANYYGKAELVLKQVVEGLSEDRAARYLEDRRRKVFGEDLARFRKEALGRATSPPVEMREPSGPATAGQSDRPVGFADYKDLLTRILRINSELNQLHFHDRILLEAVELAGAERGIIVRVQNRVYFPVASHGFGKELSQTPEFQTALSIAQDAIKRGRSILATGKGGVVSEKGEKAAKSKDAPELELGNLNHCSIIVAPFMTDERIFGGVYLDKPIVVGQFLPRNLALLETFAQHAAASCSNRREFETAIREPVTGFYTPGYFLERLREAYRSFNLHGKAFTLLGFLVPQLEHALADARGELAQRLSRELTEILPRKAAVCWGSPILNVLLQESDISSQEEIAGKVRERLHQAFGEEAPAEILPAHNRFHQGAEIYAELRSRLLPETWDSRLLSELSSLLTPQITLREAKLILERHKIEATLKKTGGNITHAAKELGIHRPQLSNLLKKHDLKRVGFETDLNGEDVEVAVEPSDN